MPMVFHNARPISSKLSPREFQVVQLIAQGKNNKEIAIAMGITVNTIKNMISMIFFKTKCNSRLQVGLKYSHLANLGAGI